MADYLPPTENLPIFDTTVFDTAQNQYLTYNQATGLFLTYPIAQGDETLQAITVQGPANFNNNLSMNNIVSAGNRQISSSYYNFYATDNNTSLTYSGRIYGNLNSIVYDCPDTSSLGSSSHVFYCYNGATPLNSLNINNLALTTNITQPAFSDTSNKIPTTAWVQGALSSATGLKQLFNYQVFNSTSTMPSSTSVQMIVPYINTANYSWAVRLQVDYSLYGNNNSTSAIDPKTLNIIPTFSGALTNVNPNTTAIIDLTFSSVARTTVVQSASNAITTLQTYLPNNINASYTYTPFTISTVNQTPTTSQSTVTLTIGFPAVPYTTTGGNYRGNITSAAVSIKILSSMGSTSGVSTISNSTAGIAYFI